MNVDWLVDASCVVVIVSQMCAVNYIKMATIWNLLSARYLLWLYSLKKNNENSVGKKSRFAVYAIGVEKNKKDTERK